MPSTLVAIKSANSTSNSDSGGSSSGKTAGIAVGVVLGVLLIAGAISAYFLLKRRKYRKISAKKETDDSPTNEEVIRQGYDKGELGTGADNQRYELTGSGPNAPKQEEPAEWVNEKASHPGHGSSMAEVDAGGVSVPELGSSRQQGPMRPLHEMYDPSAPAIELPGDHPNPGELQGSNPNSPIPSPRLLGRRSRGSKPGSPVSQSLTPRRRSWLERLHGRPEASRASTVDSLPSQMSSNGGAPSPAPPNDEAGAGHSGEPFSPVSRHGTFTPDPVSRQGTFTPDPISRQGTGSPRGILSPVSPTSPEAQRGRFAEFRGPSK